MLSRGVSAGGDGATQSVSTPRLVRVVAVLAAGFWGVLFFGLLDLLAFAQGPEVHASLLLSTGWGLLFVVLVAVPRCTTAFARSAASAAVAAELSAVAVALLAAAAMAASPRHLLPAAGVLATAALVGGSSGVRRRALLPGWRPSWPCLSAVALAAGPCAAYAWTSARTYGTSVLTDDTWSLDHWPVQAALPVAGLLVAGIAAGHPTGWRVALWSVTAADLWFAAVSWAHPDLTGSVGRAWAVAMVGWAIGFVAVVMRTRAAVGAAPGAGPGLRPRRADGRVPA